MPDLVQPTGSRVRLGRPRSLTDVVRALLSPRMLALHVVAVLATLAAVLLGVWQYGAWQHGREDQTASRVDAPAKPLATVMTSDEAFPGNAVGQPVRFAGRWLPRSTVYVADRELDGRSGVWAVTPVAVCGGPRDCGTAPAVLVVRGWARSVRDAPAPPTGAVRVTGWLQPGEGSGVTDTDPGDDVIPEMRVADAIQHVDQDLYGGYVIARTTAPTAGTGEGLAAVTPASLPKAAALTSLRNLLYALEWWVFGGFALYVWWRWCRDEVSRVTGVPSGA
jgi:cytochrome oxidase assembly protein ShyY1